MSRSRRSAKFVLAFILAGIAYLLMTVFASIANAHADTVFEIGGADVVQEPGVPRHFYMPAINNGDFCKGDNHCIIANFRGAAGVLTPEDPTPLDQSVAEAVGPLAEQIKNTPGKKTIVAISAGTPLAQEVARRLDADPSGP